MKKWIAMLLVLVIVVACTACGGNEDKSGTPNKETVANVSDDVVDTKPQNNEQEGVKVPITGEITEDMLRSHPETPITDFEYGSSTDYNGVLIKAYLGNDDIVVIPETIDGQPVVDIAEYCFANDSTVKAVFIPETVVEIGELFTNSECIEIVIADGVKIVGESTFLNCVRLKTVVLSNELTEINKGAFAGCKVLERLYIPATVTEIDEDITFSVFIGSDMLTIYGEAGSFIESFAKMVGVPFVARYPVG